MIDRIRSVFDLGHETGAVLERANTARVVLSCNGRSVSFVFRRKKIRAGSCPESMCADACVSATGSRDIQLAIPCHHQGAIERGIRSCGELFVSELKEHCELSTPDGRRVKGAITPSSNLNCPSHPPRTCLVRLQVLTYLADMDEFFAV